MPPCPSARAHDHLLATSVFPRTIPAGSAAWASVASVRRIHARRPARTTDAEGFVREGTCRMDFIGGTSSIESVAKGGTVHYKRRFMESVNDGSSHGKFARQHGSIESYGNLPAGVAYRRQEFRGGRAPSSWPEPFSANRQPATPKSSLTPRLDERYATGSVPCQLNLRPPKANPPKISNGA